MRRDTFRLLMLLGVVAFAVLYGMELSSSGISKVYGPLEQPEATRQSTSVGEEDWTLPPRKSGNGSDLPIRSDRQEAVIPRNDGKPLIDRISGAAAETLHDLSGGGIRFVVSLFDKVTGS